MALEYYNDPGALNRRNKKNKEIYAKYTPHLLLLCPYILSGHPAALGIMGCTSSELQKSMVSHSPYIIRYRCHPAKLFINIFAQAPVFISFFFAVKDLEVSASKSLPSTNLIPVPLSTVW